MITKQKTDSLSSLIKELDTWISRYVRLNAADDNGQCKCVCCDIKLHWSLMDCAHYVSRQNMATRFYLPNLAPASKACNQFDPFGHILRWEEVMPQEQKDELIERGCSMMKWTRIELSEQIEYYKSEVRQLRKRKHL